MDMNLKWPLFHMIYNKITFDDFSQKIRPHAHLATCFYNASIHRSKHISMRRDVNGQLNVRTTSKG